MSGKNETKIFFFHSAPEEGLYCKPKYRAICLFRFISFSSYPPLGSVYSKISTEPGLLKIQHSHRFVAVVISMFWSVSIFVFCFS